MKTGIFLSLFLITLCTWAQEACPCCTEAHRAFDFWVGKWEVQLADGSPAGVNHIEKEQGGCVLREQWVSAKGGLTGTSLNFYNASTDKWEQVWVDSNGNALNLKGGLEGGRMVLSSEPAENAEGKLIVNRITWTPQPDGSVRQLWEVVTEGQVARAVFDGYYRKIDE
jgi:hypothetical protein